MVLLIEDDINDITGRYNDRVAAVCRLMHPIAAS